MFTVKAAEILWHKLKIYRKLMEYMISFLVHIRGISANVRKRRGQFKYRYKKKSVPALQTCLQKHNCDAIYSYIATLRQWHGRVHKRKAIIFPNVDTAIKQNQIKSGGKMRTKAVAFL